MGGEQDMKPALARDAAWRAEEEEALKARRALVSEAKMARRASLMKLPAAEDREAEPGPDIATDPKAAKRSRAKKARDARKTDEQAARRALRAAAATHVVEGTRMVPDPIEEGARLKVRVNLAEHPLEMMLAKRRLDQALYEAGVRYRRIFERAAIGPGHGIDPGKVKVDGGRMGDPLSDSVVDAHRELAALARVLGLRGEQVVRAVCGEGVPVATLAKRWPGHEHERAKMEYLSIRLREALELLATEVWGAKGPPRGKIRAIRVEG